MKKEKNRYITPLLTVVEFKAERGYVGSVAEQINWMIEMETSHQTVPRAEAETMEDGRNDAEVSYFGGEGTWF